MSDLPDNVDRLSSTRNFIEQLLLSFVSTNTPVWFGSLKLEMWNCSSSNFYKC